MTRHHDGAPVVGATVQFGLLAEIVRVFEASVPELSDGRRRVAEVSGNSGRMLLRYNPERDDTPEVVSLHSCTATMIYVAEHEITHTMGFWHAGSEGDFNDTDWACTGTGRSERARYHASLVYSRPRGNQDPDLDPFPPLPTLSAASGDASRLMACSFPELR